MTNGVKLIHYIEVIFSDGNKIRSRINGTKEEVKTYYIGNYFNLGIEKDNMQKAVQVIFLE